MDLTQYRRIVLVSGNERAILRPAWEKRYLPDKDTDWVYAPLCL